MTTELLHAVFGFDSKANRETDHPIEIQTTGKSDHNEVSELAVNAVTTATIAVQRLCNDVYSAHCPSSIDRNLVDLWCTQSFVADNWEMPNMWDAFSQDYRTNDGFIRLHCNAKHHRNRALDVLGSPKTPGKAATEALNWHAQELEDAIVNAGGCAATLLTNKQWQNHPQGKAVAQEPIVAWQSHHCESAHWRIGHVERPLQGLKVLDLTRVIAGPVATRFLASLGADVLRIDPPGWSEGAIEMDLTVGKSCAELDLVQEASRATLLKLIRSADILVHGYRKEALDRLGFGKKTLTDVNPSLLTVSLTAYGWTGPWANRRGFDSLVQRSTGIAINNNGKIIDLPYQVLDHATGYLMAASAIEALRLRTTNNIVSAAKLSLARQAKLLTDANVNAGTVEQQSSVDNAQVAQHNGKREITSWGPGWRAPLPYQIENVSVGWHQAAHPLRSKPVEWPANNGSIT